LYINNFQNIDDEINLLEFGQVPEDYFLLYAHIVMMKKIYNVT